MLQVLGTPVPSAALADAGRDGPGAVLAPLMTALFNRALRPHHGSCQDALTPLALWMLYVRAHHLRMPAHLLVPHLVRKAVKRRLPKKAD